MLHHLTIINHELLSVYVYMNLSICLHMSIYELINGHHLTNIIEA